MIFRTTATTVVFACTTVVFAAAVASAQTWEPVPIRSVAEAAASNPGGEGHQHMRGMDRPAADPDRVYIAIDTAGTWRSEDGGRSWLKNTDVGLLSSQLSTLGADPDDPDRFFVMATAMGGWSEFGSHVTGIYRTDDAGTTFEHVHHVDFPYRHQPYERIYRQSLVFGDKSDDGIRPIFAAIDKGDLLRSDDGGDSWDVYWDKPDDAERNAWYTIVPLSNDTLLIGTTDGLHRYHDADGNGMIDAGEVTDLDVPHQFDDPVLPNGRDFGGGISGVLVHPDEPDDIVAVRRWGSSYQSLDGGKTWNEIEAVDADGNAYSMTGRLRNLDVGNAINGFQDPYRPDHRWLLTNDDVLRGEVTDDGFRWRAIPQDAIETEPYLLEPITRKISNPHSAMLFNPDTPDDIVSYRYLPWRWDGETWQFANDGFTGFAWTLQSGGARVVPPGHYGEDHPGGMVFFNNDVGPTVSLDGGHSFTMTGGEVFDVHHRGKPDTAWGTTPAGDINPLDPDHLLAFWGYFGPQGFHLCTSRDGGRTWTVTPPVDEATGLNQVNYRNAGFVRFLGKQDGQQVAVAANLISPNVDADDAKWHPIDFGVNGDFNVLAGHVPFSRDLPLPPLFATNKAMSTILMGTPDGSGDQPYTWRPVYDDDQHPLRGRADGKTEFVADPQNPTTLLVTRPGENNSIWLARFDAANVTSPLTWQDDAVEKVLIGADHQKHGLDTSLRPQGVRAMAADPSTPGRYYLGMLADGGSTTYGLDWPADADPKLADLSGNLGRESSSGIAVAPHTGDIYIGSHFGTRRLPAREIAEAMADARRPAAEK